MSLYSSLTQVLAPFAAKINGLLTGWDGTKYSTPGEAVRDQIWKLHVLIGGEPGTAISASAISYGDSDVETELDGVNGRLDELDERIADGVTEDLGNSITPTWTSGKYIQAANGREGNNSDTSATDFIPLEVNGIAKTITFTTWLVNTMCVGLYREDKSFISARTTSTGLVTEFTDIVSREDAAYIRITCYTNKIEDGFKVKYTDMNSDHVADGSIGGEKIADKAITNEKLSFNRQIPTTNKLRGYTAGGYINATTGRVTANSSMLYTDYIPLEEGKTYYARGFNGTYNAFYDADFVYVAGCTLSKSRFTVPSGQDIAYGRFTITSADAVSTAFIYKNDHLPSAYREELYATDFDIIADKTVTEEKIQFVEHDPWTNYIDMDKVETGFYINANGDKSAGAGFFCSDYIELEEGVTYYANGLTGQYCAFYDEDFVYISSFQLSSALINYAFTLPTGAKYVRVSWRSTTTTPSVSRDKGTPRPYGICQKSVRNAFNDVIPTDYTGEDIGLFNKILCCGDSLTAGGFNNDQGISIVNTKGPLYCWPTQLGKLTGCGITNKSLSGLTTPGWWSTFGNDDLSGHDAAIISLGVNDGAQLGGFTAEVETAYRNIITKLETENKGIKIFLTTVPHAMSYGSSRTYSADLIAFAESLNDPNVIILDMNLYSHLLEAMAYNCGHLSAYGYWRMAADYKAYISWYMATHKEEFRFIQFVGTDYTYSGGGATTGEI
jgi:lysophospholipase L1-like esterase